MPPPPPLSISLGQTYPCISACHSLCLCLSLSLSPSPPPPSLSLSLSLSRSVSRPLSSQPHFHYLVPSPFYKTNTIIMIIIAFKGAIRDFLQSPDSAANCLQHVRSSGPGATVCKSRATHRALITCKCHATCHLVRRDSSAIKFDRVEIAFI